MTHVFIDGSAGTTGLRIFDRLSARQDIGLISLPEERRKDKSARAEALNSADIAFLCLPDAAAQEAVLMVSNPKTAVIDTSTAHRWERGNGETLACGTGACAAVAAAVRKGLCDSGEEITVKLAGGDLVVQYDPDDTLKLTGNAVLVYEGEFEY